MDTDKDTTANANKFVTLICCRCRSLCRRSCSCWFWRREEKTKCESSLMIKLSFYSLYSDKKEIPVPPDRRPLQKKNQPNCWSAFIVDMSRDWTKLQCKSTFVSVTEGLLRLFFHFQHLSFPYIKMYWLTRNAPVKPCSCLNSINSCNEAIFKMLAWWNDYQVWLWGRIRISFPPFQGTNNVFW